MRIKSNPQRSIFDYFGEHRLLAMINRVYSNSSKIAAAHALLKVTQNEAEENSLKPHLRALKQGRLGEIYKLYLKLKNPPYNVKAKPDADGLFPDEWKYPL